MVDLNQVILDGRLAGDPEIKHLKENQVVANFTVATSWESGDKKATEYHRCTAWGYLADICAGLFQGDPVMVRGRLQTRSWKDTSIQDENKQTRYRTEVIVSTIACSRPAQKKTLAPPPTQKTWPYFDENTQIEWAAPTDDGTSYSEVGGQPICAVWVDPNEPAKGGKAFQLDEAGQKWVDWKEIAKDV
jgi:single stranded DNA-binding protein